LRGRAGERGSPGNGLAICGRAVRIERVPVPHPSPCPSPARGEGMRGQCPPHSAVRHRPCGAGATMQPPPKHKTTRRGASRPGRWRSLGGLSKTVCELCRGEVFPHDVVVCFNCFVGGNAFASGTGPGSLPYPVEISNLYAAKRSTPAPLSKSASCLRA
jgi:hypothetical protein